MALVNRLKTTGESYEKFLSRVRGEESRAEKHLPENRQQWQEWQREMELKEMMADKETVYWGYMNGWGPNEERRYAAHVEQGYKFKAVREMGGVIYYNTELKVYYRAETS